MPFLTLLNNYLRLIFFGMNSYRITVESSLQSPFTQMYYFANCLQIELKNEAIGDRVGYDLT